ncbi:MAG: BamA/TamA family outer membrane protein [Gemmatimonadota bacterium]|nr:MAG: BamA/TamA family outer membrane protein [Gemmatimonadota bacterium]
MRRFTYLFILLFIPGILLGQSEVVRRIELKLEPAARERANFLPYRQIKRPKVGLALSGGGARGLAHIGVLKALEEAGIQVDMIAGTSMGSIVGGLYAAGYSAEELERLALNIDWADLFVDTPARTDLFLGQKQEKAKHFLQIRFAGFQPYIPPAYTAGQKLSNLLTSLTLEANYRSGGDFDRLNIPFRTVTTDLVSGDKVVLSRGDLGEALRASLTVPLLFTPVERGDWLLADGGIVDYLPIDVVRAMGANIVIAVNILNSLRSKENLQSPWEVADQVISIIMMISNERQMPEADVIIDPNLRDHSSLDFSGIDRLISWGEEAARGKLDRIHQLLHEKAVHIDNDVTFSVSTVSVEPLNTLEDKVLSDKISTGPGDIADLTQVHQDLEHIYDLGYFQSVTATVEMDTTTPDPPVAHVRFDPHENPPFRRIILMNNTMFPTDSILAKTVSEPGKPLNFRTGAQDVFNILNLYHRNGYVLAKIDDIDFDEGTGIVTVVIEEGRISNFDISGNRRTREHVILREFPLQSGQVFNLNRANRGINNIYSTGLFDRVHLNIEKSGDSTSVCLDVVEKKFDLLRLGTRYDREYETEGFIEFHDDNLFGYGGKFNLHLQYGQRRQRYEINLRADRFFRTYLTYRGSAYHRRREQYYYGSDNVRRTEYRERRWGTRFAIGQQIFRLGTVSVEGRAEEVKLRTNSEKGPQENIQIRSLIFRSAVDNLDRYPFPVSGNYSHLFLELADDILGGTASYVKFFGTLESYATFFSRHTLHPKFSFGSMDLITPFSERFKVGGNRIYNEYPGEEYTVRLYGFHDEEFVGRQLLWANIEYRYKTPWFSWLDLYLSGRYDVGYLWQEAETFRSDRIKEAWGVGLAVETPVGPAEVNYGRSKKGEDRVYFSFGYWY